MDSLKLDRLTFTGNLSNEQVLENAVRFAGGHVEFNYRSAYSKTGYIPLYDNDSPLDKNRQAVVQFAGNYPNIKDRYRIDYNPSHESKNFKWLLLNMREYGGIVEAISVTRMDFAIDFKSDISAMDLQYKSGVESSYYMGRDGQLETLYYGAAKSDYRIRMYNKAREQGLKDTDWTRLECQIRNDWSLSQIENAPINPFPNVKLYSRLGQGDLERELIPIEYKAMLFYFEQFPHEERALSRRKRDKLKYYRDLSKKEIDISAIVARDMPKLKTNLFDKLGYMPKAG